MDPQTHPVPQEAAHLKGADEIAAGLIARCPEHGYSAEAWPECRCAAARKAAAWLVENPDPAEDEQREQDEKQIRLAHAAGEHAMCAPSCQAAAVAQLVADRATDEAAAALAPLAAAIREARAQHDAEQRAAGRRDGLLEGAAALQAVIDRDRAFPNARGQSWIALGGAREILLGLIGSPAPAEVITQYGFRLRDTTLLEFDTRAHRDRRMAEFVAAEWDVTPLTRQVRPAQYGEWTEEAAGGEQPPAAAAAYVPAVHFTRDDGTACCVHTIPVGPGSCPACWDLAKWDTTGSEQEQRPVPPTPAAPRTPCSVPPCDTGPGEPCDRHEREEAHTAGEHELCGPECVTAYALTRGEPDGGEL